MSNAENLTVLASARTVEIQEITLNQRLIVQQITTKRDMAEVVVGKEETKIKS